ncbi:hypothetical protein L345_12032, partial [Ophiophagus hannah]
MPEASVASPVLAFSSNLSAVMKSTGKVIRTPFFSALAIRSLTIFDPSSSNKELPIWKEKRWHVQYQINESDALKASTFAESALIWKKIKKFAFYVAGCFTIPLGSTN